MRKIGTTSSGTIIVEMTVEQFDTLSRPGAPAATLVGVAEMTPAERVSFVRERIIKLRPKKKDGVAHSIAAMFQFTGGIAQPEIQRIIKRLQKEKLFTIDTHEQIIYKG